MSKKLLGGGLVIFLLGFGYWALYGQKTMQPSLSPSTPSDEVQSIFGTAKKSAHWESNTPEHGTILAGVPVNVVVDFNFDLASPSEIRVYSSGVKNPRTGTTTPIDITSGETSIDTNRLTMRRAIVSQAPDDTYTVEYKACWPDGSCHDGNFQFAINRTLADGYTDFRGKKDVTIDLKDIEFFPKKIRVSRYTRVTWKNIDSVDHYINTDSHPSHTFFPMQNSKVLKPKEAFALVFSEPGVYPYHCSAHAQTMTGTILVE